MRLYMEPLLSGFEAAFPDITIDLTIADLAGDLATSGFDASVVANRDLNEDHVVIELSGPVNRITYASPQYLARFGKPEHPRDLKHHNCIGFRGALTGRVYDWEFQRGKEHIKVAVNGTLIVTDTAFALSAALNGKGIGYGIEQISKAFVDEGSLTEILPEWSVPHPGFVLCYPKSRQTSAALKALISYIRRQRRAANTRP